MASVSPPPRHRSPLSDTTNSPVESLSPSSTIFNPVKPVKTHLRRKLSYRTFRPPTGSLDEGPNEQVFIYDTIHLPPTDNLNQEGRISSNERGADLSSPSPKAASFNIDGVFPQSSEDSENSPLCGRRNRRGASPLETIVEQKSVSTLRKSKSFSYNFSLDGNCSSSSSNNALMSAGSEIIFPPHGNLFPSIDESVALEAGSTAELAPSAGQEILPEIADPTILVADPPQLCESPTSLPCEKQHEDTAVKSTSVQFRHSALKAPRNYFPMQMEIPGDMPNAGLPQFSELNMDQFRAASDPIPRYRLPMEGYTSLNVHPFHRSPPTANFTRPAPRARTAQAALQAVISRDQSPSQAVKSKPRHVHFTSSVKGGQGSENSIETAIEEPDPSPPEIVHPINATLTPVCQHLKRRKSQPREGLAGRNGQIGSESEGSGDSGQLVAAEPDARCWRCSCKRAWQTLCFICCGDTHDDYLPPNVRRPSSPTNFATAV